MLRAGGLCVTAPRVVVVGSLNTDRVLSVASLPARGETVPCRGEAVAQGGKGANQAAAAAVLGLDTVFVGAVGDDPDGDAGVAELERMGVDVGQVQRVAAATGKATIAVDPEGANFVIVYPGANGALDPAHVRQAVARSAAPGTTVLASLEIPLDAVVAASVAAREAGASFVLNPAPARMLPDELLSACDVLVPNEVELAQIQTAPERLFALGVGALVVTRGKEGAELVRPRCPALLVPALPVDARDTTGAGDAFVAAFCVARTLGLDLEASCRFAVVAGSLSTTGAGARGHLPSRSEVERSVGGRLPGSPAPSAEPRAAGG